MKLQCIIVWYQRIVAETQCEGAMKSTEEINKVNKIGPRTEPCGTKVVQGEM